MADAEGETFQDATAGPSEPAPPAPAPEDPVFAGDPWGANTGAGGARTTDRDPRPTETATIGSVTTASQEPPPMRIIHDIPPCWNGNNPEKELEPYLKLLRAWLITTKTLKSQRAVVIMHHATGDLRKVLDAMELEDLTAEDSGEQVVKLISSEYAEYLIKKLPAAIEAGLYDSNVARHRNESMLQYCQRRNTLFKKLDKEGWVIPPKVKAYILLRDARLPDKARDLIEMWTQGEYDYEPMVKYLKKLERPVPGSNQQRITGLIAFTEEAPAQPTFDTSDTFVVVGGQDSLEFMGESLFVLPEAFDDILLEEALPYLDQADILFVAGDISDDYILEEDEAVAILANYGQVRQYLHKKALNRGFFKSHPPRDAMKKPLKAITDGRAPPPPRPPAGGYRRFGTARPKMWSKNKLIANSKCARCGQKGHWARTCTNEPDERGKRRSGMTFNGFMVSQSSYGVSLNYPVLPVIHLAEGLVESFIGIMVTPGYGLVDTGAQHGVIGLPDFKKLVERLKIHGLKCKELPLFAVPAAGVGGTTTFVKSVEVPIAIKGKCGTLAVNVVESPLPFLLPMGFCKQLGMVLDTTDNTATWKNLGNVVSDLHELPSAHIALDILEFPKLGWMNSSDYPNTKIQREEFLIHPPKVFALCSSLLKDSACDSSSSAVQEASPEAPQQLPDASTLRRPSSQSGDCQFRTYTCRGRGGTIQTIVERIPMDPPSEASGDPLRSPVAPEQGGTPLREEGVRPTVRDADPVSYTHLTLPTILLV